MGDKNKERKFVGGSRNAPEKSSRKKEVASDEEKTD